MTDTTQLVFGSVAPGYEAVHEAFLDNFSRRNELGAACTVYRAGQPVVDLWGGSTDVDRNQTWAQETAVPIFSVTKGALFTCIHLLVERGVLDLDTPVSNYWPEFAGNGKRDILLRWVLSHQAGIPAIDAVVTLQDITDWHGVTRAVALQKPAWEPGTAHGYHPRSVGWILGEVLRRVTGQSVGAFFAQEIALPLHLDWWIGTPTWVFPRIATVKAPPISDTIASTDADALSERALSGPSALFAYDDRWNDPRYIEPEIPSSNGVATAHAVARFYSALIGNVDGIRLLTADTLDRATRTQVDGHDLILNRRSSFGLGFSIAPGLGAVFPKTAFGHPGAGGSLGFADPAAGISLGYTTNQLRLGPHETDRADALVEALYRAMGKSPTSPSPRRRALRSGRVKRPEA